MVRAVWALMWKECCEHLWKMLSIGVIIVTVVAWTKWEDRGIAMSGTWVPAWMIACWVAPIWLAAATVTSEKSRRTSETLAALPVNPTLAFAVKSVWGVVTFMGPLAIALWVGTRDFREPSVKAASPHIYWLEFPVLYSFLFSAPMLYTLLLAVVARCRREGTAAIMGVLVTLLCGLHILIVGSVPGLKNPGLGWLLILNPFDANVVVTSYPRITFPTEMLVSQCVIAIGYWSLGAGQYGRTMHGTSQGLEGSGATLARDESKWKSSFRGLASPMLWKERREQVGVLIGSLGAGAGLAVFMALMLSIRPNMPHTKAIAVHDSMAILYEIGRVLPSLVAVVLGVNAMAGDLEGKLADFWESRPISAVRLFWMKSGMAGLGVVLLLAFFQMPYTLYQLLTGQGEGHGNFYAMGVTATSAIGQAIWLPFLLAMTLLVTGLLRRVTYAVMAVGMGAIAVLIVPLKRSSEIVGTTLGDVLFFNSEADWFVQVATVMVIGTVVMWVGSAVVFSRRWRIGW